jgi:hypothetical protein
MCDAIIGYAEGLRRRSGLLEKTRVFEKFGGEDFGGEVEELGETRET